MSKDKYEDQLKKGWEEVPEPKVLPEGSWLLRGSNAKLMAGQGDQDPQVLFVHTAKEPLDDVDQNALDALGPDYDYSDNQIFSRIWINRTVDWNKVRKFLAVHGVDVGPKSTIEQGLKDFKGAEVIAQLSAKSFVDKMGEEREDNEASNFTKVE